MRRLRRLLERTKRQHPAMRRRYLLADIDNRAARPRATWTVARVGSVSFRRAAALLFEPEVDAAVRRLDDAEHEYSLAFAEGAGMLAPDEGRVLYALVRALAPDVVIETGTANGSSALFMLTALEKNGRGRMISIDLPFVGSALAPVVAGAAISKWDASPVPDGREPGWIVPEQLRDRWDLRLGDATELLPEVTETAGLFFHDSLHTREHMLFEFEQAWRVLEPGGVLVADDLFQRRHDALPAFAKQVGRSYRTFRKLGFIVR